MMYIFSATLQNLRITETTDFQQDIENTTIRQLNETIGVLLEENRLLKGPKKNSGNSSIPPSKDQNRPPRTSCLRTSSGKSSGRGQTVKTNFPAGFPNVVLVHYCCKSHLNTTATGHRLCMANLLRELLFFKQKYKSSWAAQFSEMIAIELKKTIEDRQYQNPSKERADIKAMLDSLLKQKIDPKHVKVLTFQKKRIIQYRNYPLTFLYHQQVPSDNNSSEQAIRNFKSFKGAQNYGSYVL